MEPTRANRTRESLGKAATSESAILGFSDETFMDEAYAVMVAVQVPGTGSDFGSKHSIGTIAAPAVQSPVERPMNVKCAIMHSLLIQARKASRDPEDCRKTIDALRSLGFDDAAFRRLHHQRGGMQRFCAYAKGIRFFEEDGNNHRVHQTYVLLACPDGAPPRGRSLWGLAEEAYCQIPPIA